MKRLLTLAAMFLCCMANTFAQFSGPGSGTENDPYLILNPIHLNQMRNFQNMEGIYFKLMADIDLTEFIEDEYPNGGWLPIPSFKGVLDGNGKTISNLYINRYESDNVGLFSISNGTIMNLNVNADVSGHNFVGAIVGNGQIFINCHVEGTIKGNSCVGGISGRGNTLTNCSSKVDVVGEGNRIGGLTGVGIKLTNCHSNSIVSGNEEIGGLSGYDGELSQCSFHGRVKGSSNVGGLVGSKISKSTTINSYAAGTIFATGDNVGGIIGKISNNKTSVSVSVEQCYFCGSVIGNQYVGGLIGWYNPWCYDMVNKSYANATITGRNSVGGITGKCAFGDIYNCVATNPSINATEGNIGRIFGDGSGHFGGNKAYNKSIVFSQGIVQDVTDNESGQDGMGVSATTLKLKATYVAMGWDFTDTWAIQETECYPYFKTQTAPPTITSDVISGATTISGKCVNGATVTLEIDGVKQQKVFEGTTFSFTVSPLQAGHEVRVCAKADEKEQSYFTTALVSYLGNGTEADPYRIYTAADLTGVYRKGYFKLMNDIDLTSYISQFSPTEGWQSIGREGSETIHFDGNGHKITGLWCNSTRDNTGLFSCFANGTIKNLTVETASGKQVKGGANTGILIGKIINGTIENCRVSGNVADGTPVGGMVGLFNGGSISCSQANVSIATTGSTSYVGGLVGESTGGTIDQSVTTGTLNGTGTESYVGGLVGKNYATVTNCYSSAAVTSSYNAAGLVAYNYGVVDKCYALGNLTSSNYAAGVIGYNDGISAVVKNCVAMNNKIDVTYESQQTQQGGGYGQRIIGGIKNSSPAPDMNNFALKTMQVSLNDIPQIVYDDIMNGVGKTVAELTAKATYQELGWDFTDVWKISEGEGYPYLTENSQITPEDPNPGGNGGDEGDDDIPDTDISSMNNVIYLNKVETSAGSQINLSIRMKNAAAIRGFQFDLYLPDGVTVVKSAKGKIVGSLSEGRLPEDDEHTLTLSEQSDGAIRFLCGSLYDETFTGNDGEIATLSVKIAENKVDGNYAIILKDIKMTETDINNYYQTEQVKSTLTITSYTPGDINGDGKVDVSDYIGIANHIMGNTPEGFVVKAADVNEDSVVDVSDYIGVANIILTGSIYGNTNNARTFLYEKDVEQEIDPE